jgi:hypothetical protein
MKGFKKDGKFIPTGNKSKSSLKKTDVRKKQTVGVNEVNSLLRTKKTVTKNEIKVVGVTFWTAENYGIAYHINDEGKVVYEGGIRTALETLGARKLSTKEIGVLMNLDDNSGYDYGDFYGKDANKEEVAEEYARDQQNDHSQNFLPATEEDYNFGLFKVQGRPYISITGDDDKDDGIYDLMYILDEEGLGEDHQSWYAGRLIDPELIIRFTANGKKHEIRKANERDDRYYDMEVDGSYNSDDSVLGEDAEDLDNAVEKFIKGEK